MGDHEWILDLETPLDREFVFKIVIKDEKNNIFWEKDTLEPGGNHSCIPGKGVLAFTPSF